MEKEKQKVKEGCEEGIVIVVENEKGEKRERKKRSMTMVMIGNGEDKTAKRGN